MRIPRERRSANIDRAILIVTLIAFFGTCIAFSIVDHRRRKAEDLAESRLEAIAAYEDLNSKKSSEVVSWRDKANAAEDTVETLEAENDAIQGDLEEALRAQENLQRTVERVRVAPERVASGKAWSSAKVRSTLEAACAKYGITGSDKAWIVAAGLKVAWGESRYNPSARNGSHLGIMQFRPEWGTAAQRLNGTWSLYRFVRVFRDGGKAKIQQHWAATI